ncbi:hypothetical protein [Abyssogena phaseoliformis symbiont]|nr:hypothetical protein [Abyssogena phaseoliformis symbiont]
MLLCDNRKYARTSQCARADKDKRGAFKQHGAFNELDCSFLSSAESH